MASVLACWACVPIWLPALNQARHTDALPGGMGAVTSLGCDPLQSSSEIACWYSLVERAPLRQNISSGRGKALSKAAHCVISSGDW